MFENIQIFAGKYAYARVRDGGLKPEMVRVVAGAAGGPKWLVLNQLDRYLFGTWLKDLPRPLFLLGASIGAWRFAAAAQNDPVEAIGRFEEAYINQRYNHRPTPEEISRETRKIRDVFLTDAAVAEILSHPYMRLNVLSVRCGWPASSENRIVQGAGFIAAAALNYLNRNNLKYLFKRILFHDPRDKAPFFFMDQFPSIHADLTRNNLKQALLASGSIPMVMAGVRNVQGAPAGMYRDAGIIDYHLDIPFLQGQGIVLYPHFMKRIIPGWLDKNRKSRQPDPEHMASVVQVAPSPTFLERLPLKKITDRDDFIRFEGRDDERIEYWRTVVREGKRLADDFMEAVESGRIRDIVRPMFP